MLSFGGLNLDEDARRAIESWAEDPGQEAEFLAEYQELFEMQDFSFLLAAVQFDAQSNHHLRDACARIYLLVRKYKFLEKCEQEAFFDRLAYEDELDQKSGTFTQLLDEIKQAAGVRYNTVQVPDDMASTWSVESWVIPPALNHYRRRSVHNPSLPSVEEGRQSQSIPTFMKPLHEDFTHRDSRFFCTGRVFKMLWHENATSGNRYLRSQGSTADGIHGQRVFSHIRRFAVVRECHGFSWAVGMNTYQSQGVKKPSFNKADIQAHAIIHMTGTKAVRLNGEPYLEKKPIMVDKGTEDSKLDPASRIRFDKVFSIEHNVRVKDVGIVSPQSMAYFCHYWQLQATAAAQAAVRKTSAP